MSLNCPHCCRELTLIDLYEDQDWRELMLQVAKMSHGIGPTLLRYLTLFYPVKQKLRPGRMLKIVSELVPMIDRQEVKRHGTLYRCSLQQWATTIQALSYNPPPTLRLPLKDNKYLIGMLANQCEKIAAEAENKREAFRKNNNGEGRQGGAKALRDILQREEAHRQEK